MKKKHISVLVSGVAAIAGVGYTVAKKLPSIKRIVSWEKTDMPEGYPEADAKYRDSVKRALDLAICIPACVIAAIPMAITAVAVKLDSPGPILFRQKRLGLNGQEFEMLKFRSMCVGAEHTGSGVYSGAGDARVTKVGSRMSSKGQKNKNNFNKHPLGVFFLPFFEALCPYYGYREVPQHS